MPGSVGRPKMGSIERSVSADIRAVKKDKRSGGFRETLAQMALRLARAYDAYQGEDMAKLARLNQELRATLEALREGDGGQDAGQQPAPGLPAPVWDE